MSKIKSNKEYSIRLVFPEIGNFYFYRNDFKYNWSNSKTKNNYLFTKDLSKARKWKIKKIVDELVDDISSSKGDIYLLLGNDISLMPEYMKSNITCSMKKYRYRIDKISTKKHIEQVRLDINGLDILLLEDSEIITKLINSKKTDSEFFSFLKKFENDIKQYRKFNGFLSIFDNKSYIEIIDSSFNFRTLKLNTIKLINEE